MDTQRTYNPITMNKEISILKEIGLDDDEINYLLFIKRKRVIEQKWTD